MVYALKIDGYGLEPNDYEDYQEYCIMKISPDMEEIEEYISNNPRASNETYDIYEIYDWHDALNCLVTDNRIYPDNLEEVFSELGMLLMDGE